MGKAWPTKLLFDANVFIAFFATSSLSCNLAGCCSDCSNMGATLAAAVALLPLLLLLPLPLPLLLLLLMPPPPSTAFATCARACCCSCDEDEDEDDSSSDADDDPDDVVLLELKLLDPLLPWVTESTR